MKVIFGSLLMESEDRATSLFYDLYHLLSSKTLLLSGVGVRGRETGIRLAAIASSSLSWVPLLF